MRVYISGPISAEVPGTTREERKDRFNLCEAWINEHRTSWHPVNPLKVEACIAPDAVKCDLGMDDIWSHTWECWLRYDLKALLDCEGIVLLPGWQQSRGASLEKHVAFKLKMKPYMANERGEIIL